MFRTTRTTPRTTRTTRRVVLVILFVVLVVLEVVLVVLEVVLQLLLLQLLLLQLLLLQLRVLLKLGANLKQKQTVSIYPVSSRAVGSISNPPVSEAGSIFPGAPYRILVICPG